MDPTTCSGRKTFSPTAGFWISFLFVTLSPQASAANSSQTCVSSCGKIPKITYPFRLKDDPKHCGDPKHELDCINNVAVLQLTNSVQYNVQAINYNNYTIRLVDPNIQAPNCSSIPRYFLYKSNFTYFDDEGLDGPYQVLQNSGSYELLSLDEEIIYLTCENSATEDDRKTSCLDDPNTYAIVGVSNQTLWERGCRVTLVSLASVSMKQSLIQAGNYSYSDIHAALVYGFELSWLDSVCDHFCGSKRCYFDIEVGNISCYQDICLYFNTGAHRCGFWAKLGVYIKTYILGILGGTHTRKSKRWPKDSK